MSQSLQQGGQPRQPVSYPSPTSYPSPNLSNAQYSYPVPNQQQINEPYRASPTGSNGSLSLPSMRSVDPLQQQQQQQQQQLMAASLPPPVAPMGGPYYHNPQGMPHHHQQYPGVTSDPNGIPGMRYALPVTDSRVMSGGRHKKEIKRRTKTGCLTCRKRRIKCDEAHPACRNCQKSKRECLGYDPIFKQQPGPAPIQPAPSAAPSQISLSAIANPYGNQPMMSGYGGVPSMAYDPALSAGVSSPDSSGPQFDQFSAIDPALEGAAPQSVGNANQFQQSSGMPNPYENFLKETSNTSSASTMVSTLHLRGGVSSFASPSSSFSYSQSSAYTTSAPITPTTIEELLNIGGPAPQAASSPGSFSSEMIDEVKHLYHSIYSPGLENFLETKWFSIKGIGRLLQQNILLEQFGLLLQEFSKTSPTNAAEMQYTASLESRVVWALACLCRFSNDEQTQDAEDAIKQEPQTILSNDDAIEAGRRLTVFEHLLCGTVADSNVLTAPSVTTDPVRIRETEFWYQLGAFVTLGENIKALDDTMSVLRGLLDGRENRDVLYSICVVRGLGPRVKEYGETETPLHLDEQDARSKLAVAKRFVKDEGLGSGTSNVIRRLCTMATASWEGAPAHQM